MKIRFNQYPPKTFRASITPNMAEILKIKIKLDKMAKEQEEEQG